MWVSSSAFSHGRESKAPQSHRGILDPGPEHQGHSSNSGSQMTANISGGHLGLELKVLLLEESICISSNGYVLTFNTNGLKLTLKWIYVQLVPLATFCPDCLWYCRCGLSWGSESGKGGKLPLKMYIYLLGPFFCATWWKWRETINITTYNKNGKFHKNAGLMNLNWGYTKPMCLSPELKQKADFSGIKWENPQCITEWSIFCN